MANRRTTEQEAQTRAELEGQRQRTHGEGNEMKEINHHPKLVGLAESFREQPGLSRGVGTLHYLPWIRTV